MIEINYQDSKIILSTHIDHFKQLRRLTSDFSQHYQTEINDIWTIITDISNFPFLIPIFKMPKFQPDSETLKELTIAYNTYMNNTYRKPESVYPSVDVKRNWVYLKNLPDKFISILDNELSYFYPDYQRIPSFKKGEWDGKKHLLKRYEDHYRCRKGLLMRVITSLKSKNIIYTQTGYNVPLRPDLSLELDYNGPVLWDHQDKAFMQCCLMKSGTISIATGGGKTVLMTRLTQHFSISTNVFINSVDTGRQLYSVFCKHLGSENVGFIGDSICDIKPNKINIIILPTAFLALWSLGEIKRWKVTVTDEGKKEYKLKKCKINTEFYHAIVDTILGAQMSIYDECDVLGAETYSYVSTCTKSLLNFGFSATPYRNDGKDLEIEAGCGKIIYDISVSDLIDKKILVPADVHIYAVPRSVELKGKMAYPSIYKACIKENSLRNLMITKIAKEFVDKGLTGIILVIRIDQGKEINKRLKDEGIHSKFIHGSDSALTRNKAISMLQRKDLSVIVTTLFARGMDIPEIQFGIRGKAEGAPSISGKPNSDIPQFTGRLLRVDPKNPHKTRAYLVDFIDPYPYLRDHSLARIEAYKNERNFNLFFKELKQE